MALKTFTKTSFSTCMQAFYDEIKTTHEQGEPEVVLFLYGENSVKFNPRDNIKVCKNEVVIGDKSVKFKDIRGLDFYFKNDTKLEPKDEKAKPLPKVDFNQFMADKIAKMKENMANNGKVTQPDAGMQQYQELLKSLGAK